MAVATKHPRDFSREILDLDGKPMRVGYNSESVLAAMNKALQQLNDEGRATLMKIMDEEIAKPLTLARACSMALTAPLKEESRQESDITARFSLSMKVHGGGIVEITPEERDLAKKCLGKMYSGALVAPRCWALLEEPPVTEVVKQDGA